MVGPRDRERERERERDEARRRGASPSGLADGTEDQPLGVDHAEPEGEEEPKRGPEAMPGIPTEGEPPSAG